MGAAFAALFSWQVLRLLLSDRQTILILVDRDTSQTRSFLAIERDNVANYLWIRVSLRDLVHRILWAHLLVARNADLTHLTDIICQRVLIALVLRHILLFLLFQSLVFLLRLDRFEALLGHKSQSLSFNWRQLEEWGRLLLLNRHDGRLTVLKLGRLGKDMGLNRWSVV